MFNGYRNAVFAVAIMICAFLSACGDSGTRTATLTANSSTLVAGTLGTAYTASLSASGGTTPYTWAIASGGDLPGGLSLAASTGTISGTPTTAGTFGPYVFTVTDAKGATASTTGLSITVNAVVTAACATQGNEAALTTATPYAFLLKGSDANGSPVDIAGSFTPNGAGGITAASLDYNGFASGFQPFVVNIANSSYSFGSGTQGCLYLSISLQAASRTQAISVGSVSAVHANAAHSRKLRTANSRTGSVGSARPQLTSAPSNVKFQFTLAQSQTGRIIESDGATDDAGFIYVQTPSSFALGSLKANYAFGVDGWFTPDGTSLVRSAIAGTFANSNGTLSLGFADSDNGGTITGALTGGSGSINATFDAATGRGTGHYTSASTNAVTFDFVLYVLNASDLIIMSTDSPNQAGGVPLLGGRALEASSTYDPGSLQGFYLYAAEGYNPTANSYAGGNFVQIGTLNGTSTGAIPTATIYYNDAGTVAHNIYVNGSYVVDPPSGRVTATGIGSAPPIAYLVANGADDDIVAFTVGTDQAATSGVLVRQSEIAPDYTASLLAGTYGGSTDEDMDGTNGSWIGNTAFNGAGAYTVSSPLTIGTVGILPGATGVYTVNTDGSGTLDTNFIFVTNGSQIYAIPNSGDPLLFIFEFSTD